MKKLKLFLLLGSIVLLNGCGKNNAEPAAVTPPPTAVTVRSAKKASIINSDTFSSRTQAATEIAVTAEMAGTVEKVYVTLGQKVQKGDKLLSIKAVDANKSVDQARAALEIAKAAYTNALGGSVDNQLNQLENGLKLAEIGYEEAKRNYDMYKQLYESDGISEDQFKKIELAFVQAEQQLNNAKKAYETSKNQTIPESQAMAKKQLEQAEVSYKIASSNLDKLTLTAPANGIITTVNFNDNEMISQSMPAFIISDLNALEVDLQVTEMDMNKFKTGDTVSVNVSDKILSGVVKDVSLVTDSRSSLYIVKISIDNTSHQLPAGMAIDIRLTTEKTENAVTIPKKAVFEEDDQKYIYICTDDKAVKTPVETGLSDAYSVEIIQGIKEGDRVVIGNISLIKDGDSLFPVEKEE
ncbi:efflux RND transporter periplasmic adaptor subunit [Cellulosilyticum sp. I15G10I2]|uniref:efflux RND transporter periplasmic adaptor subunit n=1 Tax=Cellulosilyticum sp. I15G10I2 TaxID=1892843 RepID=UPI00085CAC88|nr:efflux RND transporter periplasmic adaptor subunit [Cellulosilyticum sp. I15G10I2]